MLIKSSAVVIVVVMSLLLAVAVWRRPLHPVTVHSLSAHRGVPGSVSSGNPGGQKGLDPWACHCPVRHP